MACRACTATTWCPDCARMAAAAGLPPLTQTAVRTPPHPAVRRAPLVSPGRDPRPASLTSTDVYHSQTEHRYAQRLAVLQHDGTIVAWQYEPVRLWLRPGMSYTPDFVVQRAGIRGRLDLLRSTQVSLTPAVARYMSAHPDWQAGQYVFYETKARVIYEERRAFDRLKMAAALYPTLHFRLARWDRTRHDWVETEVAAC